MRTHVVSPVADATRMSTENGVPSFLCATHRRSHSVRSCGVAKLQGAVPFETGAPPRTRVRNASLAARSRQLVSASKTPTGRAAVTASMDPLSQTEYRQWWNKLREWLVGTLREEAPARVSG
jgi:hypothetical protein